MKINQPVSQYRSPQDRIRERHCRESVRSRKRKIHRLGIWHVHTVLIDIEREFGYVIDLIEYSWLDMFSPRVNIYVQS